MKKKIVCLLILSIVLSSLFFVAASCDQTPNLSLVKFENATYTYDGVEKSITVSGVPAGAQVSYSPANTYTEVGEYKITATVTAEKAEPITLSATLKIVYSPEFMLKAEIEELVAQLSSVVANNKQLLETNLQTLQSAYETKVAELSANIATNETAIAQLTATYEAKVAEIESTATADKQALQEELNSAKAQLQGNIDELTATYEAKVAEIESTATADKQALQEELNSAKAQLQGNIDELTATYEAKVAEIESSVAESKKAMEDALNAEVETISNAIAQLQSALETEESNRQTAIETLQQNLSNRIDAAEAIIAQLQEVDTAHSDRLALLEQQVAQLLEVTYHTVSFNSDGGTVVENQIVAHGEKAVCPATPTKQDFTFEGWFVGEEKWSFVGYTVTEDITLTAKWKSVYSTITFDSNGGTAVEPIVAQNETIVQLPKPQNGEFAFVGWFYNGVRVENNFYVAQDVSLVARWQGYTILDVAEGFTLGLDTVSTTVPNNQTSLSLAGKFTLDEGCSCQLFADVALTQQYSFMTVPTLQEGANIAYAVVIFDDAHFSVYTVQIYRNPMVPCQFVSQGEIVSTTMVEEGQTVEAPAAPTKQYYNFVGWCVDGQLVSFPFQVTGATQFEATFTPTQYTISFNYDGGEETEQPISTFNVTDLPLSLATLVSPAKEDCYFDGWYLQSNPTQNISQISQPGNVTLNARWRDALEGWVYTLNSNKSSYTVTAYNGTETSLAVASLHHGLPVTAIGNAVFQNKANITDVVIPDSVTSIGSNAFDGCARLQSVVLPSGLQGISGYLFNNCAYLQNIVVPQSVKYISNKAFCNCKSLQCVTFAENSQCTSIGYDAFFNCSSLTNITIPEGVTSIGSSAFANCSSLTSITIPEGVTSIGSSAFANCSSLTSVNIPEDVTSIDSYAFEYCSSLTSINIPEGVTSIGSAVFRDCTSLTNITIPSSVTNIGSEAFYGCSCLTIYCEITEKFILWDDNWNLSNRPVVWDCNNNDVATDGKVYFVSDGIRYVLADGTATVVRQAPAIKEATIPQTVTYKNTDYTVTSIGNSAFSGCSSLTSVNISESITSIGSSAFYGCSSLTSITIPEGVTSIGSSAFVWCRSLESISVAAENTIYRSEGDCLIEIATNTLMLGCKNSVIPTSVTSIGNFAFGGCSELTGVTIPEVVTSIGEYAFYNCTALTEIHYNATNCTNLGENNYVFYKVGQDGDGIVVTIGANVQSIPACLFYPYYNGSDSPKIINVVFEENSQCTSIGSSAFQYCSKLTSIIIPTSVRRIGDYAFYSCSALTSIIIPSSVTSIGYSAFYNCSSLTNITIPSSVTSIGNYAFYCCTALTEIHYNATNCANLSSNNSVFYNAGQSGDGIVVTIGANVQSIPAYLFNPSNNSSHSPKITSVVFEEDSQCTSIGNSAFSGCSSLTSIIIPTSVTSVGEYAFYGCSSLTIYCEATSQPSGWDSSWNPNSRPVVWGYEG